MNMSGKRGRPKVDFPPELIQEIIYRYAKEQKVTGKIAYMDVYRFSKVLYDNGEIQFNIGEFYWRKGDGRTAIDKANQVTKHNVSDGINEDESFVDTRDAVNKLFTGKDGDKGKLIEMLKMNETKLQRYIKKCRKLEKDLIDTKEALQKEKMESKKNKEITESYQETLFQWMELSLSKNNPLTNLLTTGKSRTRIVDELFKDIFSKNPLEVFHKMNELNDNGFSKGTTQKKDNLLSINKSDSKRKSILDDIGF